MNWSLKKHADRMSPHRIPRKGFKISSKWKKKFGKTMKCWVLLCIIHKSLNRFSTGRDDDDTRSVNERSAQFL
jgi:hypothetical protein